MRTLRFYSDSQVALVAQLLRDTGGFESRSTESESSILFAIGFPCFSLGVLAISSKCSLGQCGVTSPDSSGLATCPSQHILQETAGYPTLLLMNRQSIKDSVL